MDHGEPGIFVSFGELLDELAKNVLTLGFDLPRLIEQKKLAIECVTIEHEINLDVLFARVATAITIIGAKRAVLDTVDPLFARVGDPGLLRQELLRLFQWLKAGGITSIITGEVGQVSITRHGLEEYASDCVIALDQRAADQITTRRLRIVKYRGPAHGTNEYPHSVCTRGAGTGGSCCHSRH
jgi:circadian clock protein KaiC